MKTEREKGLRFEIYVEQLFRDCGFEHVQRNLIYIRNGWLRGRRAAQVDIQTGNNGIISSPSVYELKYSSNGPVSCRYGNPVDQLLRAVSITGFKAGGIVTNRTYTQEIMKYARRKGVVLYDIDYLLTLDKKRKSIDGLGLICVSLIGKSLEDRIEIVNRDIAGVNPNRYDNSPKTMYI